MPDPDGFAGIIDIDVSNIEIRAWVRPDIWTVRDDASRYHEIARHLAHRGELLVIRLDDGRIRYVDRLDPRRVFATFQADGTTFIRPARTA